MNWKFEVGQRVRKTGGYPFPGIVEARFMAQQIDGKAVERYVVNQTVVMHQGIGPSGLLHIFAPAQLQAIADDGEEYIAPHAPDVDRDGVLIKPVRGSVDRFVDITADAAEEVYESFVTVGRVIWPTSVIRKALATFRPREDRS